jgi:hypothetical protein
MRLVKNQKPETRNQKPETRNQKPEIRRKSQTRNPKRPDVMPGHKGVISPFDGAPILAEPVR